ncbi:hypothetical protein PIB30_032220 [Stylosanthes scabra]|uniref:Uncharacterized protein n=1 Tax=Stylosanthes scabra TaxID=79078 RepID=A0ABU6TBS0_9FABA|nr:hypothetical protein [Stylosanthes scabra]
MDSGESGEESSRVNHGETTGNAGRSDKGESEGEFASKEKEGNHKVNGCSKDNHGFKVSFRDKVVDGEAPKPFVIHDDLDGDRLAVVVERNDDSSRPKITFSEEGLEVFAKPYVDTLRGGYEILEVGHDYFLVKRDLKEDRENVLIGGRGQLMGTTLLSNLDLNRPVIDEMEIGEIVYKVDYENLELICGGCKCFGHVIDDFEKKDGVKPPIKAAQPSEELAFKRRSDNLEQHIEIAELVQNENGKNQDAFEKNKDKGKQIIDDGSPIAQSR